MFGIEGMKCFKETCKYAKEKGMIVIADIKTYINDNKKIIILGE